MRKIVLLLAAALFSTTLHAQTGREWQDPAVNAINREPMRASFRAGERLSLDGIWKFCWVRNAEQRPQDIERMDYDDSAWGTMPVPGIWELNGYGDPVYVNTRYAWRGHYQNNPPVVPEDENHVGSYRRRFSVPESWTGKDIFLSIGSATSNVYVWINGHFVGYSEDSKLAAGFDITRYVHPGENRIALQLFRWCDGTYLEDQDFWRLSGIARGVELTARDKAHLVDLNLTPVLDAAYTDATLQVEAWTTPGVKNVLMTLRDAAGAVVAEQRVRPAGGRISAVMAVPDPAKWSAEKPNLYALELTLFDARRRSETLTQQVGFRSVEIRGAQLLVNGQPVLIKGVNRHEMDPLTGYVVSRERMIEDIRIMKELNINAVRTCHYPNDPLWYELCDLYGIYLFDEANVESHGMGYGDKTLAKDPAYAAAHLERNERMVRRDRNHPSVLVWSLGNEAGMGPNFEACYRWVKQADPSRVVHYERAVDYDQKGQSPFTDIVCPMYADYDWCERYCKSNPSKPLIQCEYAHAMGNSMGGLDRYWELVRKYPAYQGGFIWDFVDQGFARYEPDGRVSFLYGGDYNNYDPTDNSFNNNGVIAADRTLHPHAREVQRQYQSCWVRPLDLAAGRVELYNEHFFTNLSDYALEWRITCDGQLVRMGRVDQLDLAPQSARPCDLDYTLAGLPASGELLLNVQFVLKEPQMLLAPGHVAAQQQFVLRGYDCAAAFVLDTVERPLAVSRWERGTRVAGDDWQLFFSREGFLTDYQVRGRELISAELRPQFWRAPTENDLGAGLDRKNAVWKAPELKLTQFDATPKKGFVLVEARYEMPEVQGVLRMSYRINGAGEIVVTQAFTAGQAEVPNLLRYGMRFAMPARYDRIEYYGRGPEENYADRLTSADIGLYRQRVDDQYHDHYVRPQESGTKTDVRRWAVVDSSGSGLAISSQAPFSASALRYATEDLDVSNFPPQQHSGTLVMRDATCVNIDLRQSGLGCINSWGRLPEKQYRLPYGDYTFRFMLKPIQ